MKNLLKGTLLAALPLVGLLLTAPTAEARHHHHHWRNHSYCRPYSNQGWYNSGRYNDYYRGGWYGERRPYYDDYYSSRYPWRPYSGGSPWGSFFYNR